MAEKRVRWVIDVPDGLSDDEAALWAWQAMHRPGTLATVMEVKEDGWTVPWREVDVQLVLNERYVGRPIRSRGTPSGHSIRGAASPVRRHEGTVVAVIPTCSHCDLWCLVPSWGAHAPDAGPCVSLFEELDDEHRTLVLK